MRLASTLFIALVIHQTAARANDCDSPFDPANCLCAHFAVTEVAFGVTVPEGLDYRLEITEVIAREGIAEHAYAVGDRVALPFSAASESELWIYTQSSSPEGYVALGAVTDAGGIRNQSFDAGTDCGVEMEARELARIWTGEQWADCNSVVRSLRPPASGRMRTAGGETLVWSPARHAGPIMRSRYATTSSRASGACRSRARGRRP